MRTSSTLFPLWLAGLLWLSSAGGLFAHDPGLSSAEVTLGPGQTTVVLTLNARDWALTGIDTPEGLRQECVRLTLEGAPLPSRSSSGPVPDQTQNVVCTLTYPGLGAGRFTFESLLFDRLPFGHREFVQVHDGQGHLLAEQMLRQDNASCAVTLRAEARSPDAPPAQAAFLSFLSLGVQHILTGTDHLLFLGGLLLACAGFRQAAGVITWFTLAHSLTLALSVLNVVVLPARLVEAAVAASIVWIGVENVLRPDTARGRGRLAFCFGLVHGLGFASVLRAMGIGTGGTALALPLLSFNFGVELGQLAVALAVLPLIFLLRRQPAFRRLGAPALSVLIASLGAFWLLQRLAGIA